MQGVMLVLKVKLYKFIGFSWSPLFFFFLKLSKGHLELGPLDGMFLNSYFLQGVCVPPVVQWLITSVISDFSANIVSNLGILPISSEVWKGKVFGNVATWNGAHGFSLLFHSMINSVFCSGLRCSCLENSKRFSTFCCVTAPFRGGSDSSPRKTAIF